MSGDYGISGRGLLFVAALIFAIGAISGSCASSCRYTVSITQKPSAP